MQQGAKGKERVLRPFSLQVGERSTSPRWDEAFHFLVRDPKEESLTVKVTSSIYGSSLFKPVQMLRGRCVSVRSCLTAGARPWAP